MEIESATAQVSAGSGRRPPRMTLSFAECFSATRAAALYGLRLDENHEGFGENPVVGHRLCGLRALHRGHNRIHVGHVHEHGDASPVRRIDKGSDVGHAKRAEELFPLRRGKPMIRTSW